VGKGLFKKFWVYLFTDDDFNLPPHLCNLNLNPPDFGDELSSEFSDTSSAGDPYSPNFAQSPSSPSDTLDFDEPTFFPMPDLPALSSTTNATFHTTIINMAPIPSTNTEQLAALSMIPPLHTEHADATVTELRWEDYFSVPAQQ